MRRGSWPVRREAYLWACPACGTRNGLNAPRCWQCEKALPPPSEESWLAAWAALAPESFAAAPAVTVLPSVAVACGIVSRASVYAARRPNGPRPAPAADASAAKAGQRGTSARPAERFGAVPGGVASPRRPLRLIAAALAFLALVVAGYPVYRDAARAASTLEVRRAPFPTALHHLDSGAARPQAVAVTGQEPHASRTAIRPASPTPRPTDARPSHPPSIAAHHAAHAARAAPRGARVASVHRVSPRGPVLVAGEVSFHDAALGR